MRAKHILGAVVCLAAALPSYALTNISACGTYSTNDNYVVTADISSSSPTVACLTWSGISNTTNGIYIDLNGHNVVSTGFQGIDIETCVANIYIHDSVGTGSVRGRIGVVVGPTAIPAINIVNSATKPGGWILITGVHTYSEIYVQSTDKVAYPMKSLHGEYNTFHSGGWNINSVDNATLTGETIDNRNEPTVTAAFAGGFTFANCSGSRVEYSTVIGGQGSNSLSPTLNTDDAVVSTCTAGNTCSDHIADHITSYDLFDAGWEGLGHLTDMHITNNVFYRTRTAGVGGYYIFSLGNSEIRNNTVTGATRLFYMFGASGATEASNFFTNNVFDGNKIDASTSSIFGVVGPAFATFSNNTFRNNDFGFGATVQFQSAAGVIDGGGNRCGVTSPSGAYFTC